MSEVRKLAEDVLSRCRAKGLMLATAESCTGGMIAAALTDIAGSSAVVDRGFVTYSNEAKMEMIGVHAETLAAHGAVSEETATEMAAGALTHSRAGIAVSVTGIAGPDGGSPEKPVGLVCFGIARKGHGVHAQGRLFENKGRAYIRGESLSDQAVRSEIIPCFVDEMGRKTDIVVLACTHYPFMANLFRKLAPWPVDWLDPAEAIARQARRLVPPLDTVAPGEDIAVFTSATPDFATRRLMQGFGLRVV